MVLIAAALWRFDGLFFPDDADFGVEFDAVGFFDAALDFVNQAEDVFCCGAPSIDDEAGVLF